PLVRLASPCLALHDVEESKFDEQLFAAAGILRGPARFVLPFHPPAFSNHPIRPIGPDLPGKGGLQRRPQSIRRDRTLGCRGAFGLGPPGGRPASAVSPPDLPEYSGRGPGPL